MSYLGFDTSCYTTSVALYDGGKVISKRQLLTVKPGERGLRQSEALFMHVKNMPALYRELAAVADLSRVEAVGVSVQPTDAAGSYMPVFLAGKGFAEVASQSLGVPLYTCSHQTGHVLAGAWSCNALSLLDAPYTFLHISGGTTEIVQDGAVVGGTLDLAAGQLIDRVGVRLGLPFPCGKHLDTLACSGEETFGVPLCVHDGHMNLSGLENFMYRKIDEGTPPAVVARSLFLALAKALEQALLQLPRRPCLFVGGVASNSIIRAYLTEQLPMERQFAAPEFATDNGAGTAIFAALQQGGA